MPTPWDSRVFGIDTYEIKVPDEGTLRRVGSVPGHYTVKVDPFSSKKLLHEHGFYYCDTLIRPVCPVGSLVEYRDGRMTLSRETPYKDLAAIVPNSFYNGRFHKDFNVTREQADARYVAWLKDLYATGDVLALIYDGGPAGFLAYQQNRVLLHALGADYRGKGLSKFFFSLAFAEMFKPGHDEIVSSISASNAGALNLYASLGFKFGNELDVYHRLVR